MEKNFATIACFMTIFELKGLFKILLLQIYYHTMQNKKKKKLKLYSWPEIYFSFLRFFTTWGARESNFAWDKNFLSSNLGSLKVSLKSIKGVKS